MREGEAMIVVTGATGQLGQLVVDGLLWRVDPGQVAVAVRSPEKAAGLAARGVSVRMADYNEPEQLGAAFVGAERVLLISGNDPRRSAAQHAAVVDAVRRAEVGLLAYTSLWHADTTTMLTATSARLTEPVIRDSGLPYTFLRNNLYTDHYALQIKQAAKSGVFVGSAGAGRVASATRADYAAAAVAVLTGEGHENKTYELGGDVAWSYAELAAVLSKVTGQEIAYRAVSAAEHHALLVSAGIPSAAADYFIDTYAAIADGQLAGAPGQLRALIGRPTTTLDDAVTAMLAG
jgi:NAD(P)H dehydrogenase (quinone)